MDRTSFVSLNQANIPLPKPLMPSVKAIAGIGDAAQSAVTPTTVVQRLPSIVNPTAVNLSDTCDPLAMWVSEHPLLAIGGLAVVAYFTILKK